MSDEVKTTIERDDGLKNQWGRRFFYRADGKKRTLDTKRIFAVAAVAFILVSVVIAIQGPPESISASRKKQDGMQAPLQLTGQVVDNIPQLGSDAAKARTLAASNSGKTKVAAKVRFTGPQLLSRPNSGKIPPGSYLKAKLVSGGSNGPVRAVVVEGFSVNGELIIEEGTILVGSGQSSEDRLNIRFSQMVFKDGSFQTIEAQACDGGDQIAGLKGSKVGSQAVKLATGIGLNFVGGMTEALQDTQGENGAVVRKPTMRNALLNGAATATLDQSREIMSNIKNKPPVIEVPIGTDIYVLFQGNN
jgi:hypothetical protein